MNYILNTAVDVDNIIIRILRAAGLKGKEIDYNTVGSNIDLNNLRVRINDIATTQQKQYLNDLHKEIENYVSAFLPMQAIRNTVDLLQSAVFYLKNFKSDSPIKEVVVEVYKNNYIAALQNIEREYRIYYPQLFVDYDDTFSRLLNSSMIFKSEKAYSEFLGYEDKLIQKKFLSQSKVWMNDKKKLVEFYLYCQYYSLLTDFALHKGRGLDYLQLRYTIDLKDQSKPSKYKQYKQYREVYYFLNKSL